MTSKKKHLIRTAGLPYIPDLIPTFYKLKNTEYILQRICEDNLIYEDNDPYKLKGFKKSSGKELGFSLTDDYLKNLFNKGLIASDSLLKKFNLSEDELFDQWAGFMKFEAARKYDRLMKEAESEGII